MSELIMPEAPAAAPPDGLGIGDAASTCGVSVDTLRYYEKEGLFLAPAVRDSGGRRRYSSRDLAWASGLVMLRETGMTISEMRRMAELYRTPGTELERLRLLKEHRNRVIAKQARTAKHLAAIESKISAYEVALARPTRRVRSAASAAPTSRT
jgi:DNA-binding transcriptional MerR regulator